MSPDERFHLVIIAVVFAALWALAIALPVAATSSGVPATVETRYCGVPKRDHTGAIYRSPSVRAAFQRQHPCPVTGLRSGACPGWSVDHVIPLASCGCDSVSNMQWLPNGIKSAAGVLPKDRWELRVYRCPP